MEKVTLSFSAPAPETPAAPALPTIVKNQPAAQTGKTTTTSDGTQKVSHAIKVREDTSKTTDAPAPTDAIESMTPEQIKEAYKALRTKMSSNDTPAAKTPEQIKQEEAAAAAAKAAAAVTTPAADPAYTKAVSDHFTKEAGSLEAVPAMLAWAAENLTPESATAFDEAVTSGNAAHAQAAISILAKAYKAENGKESGKTVADLPAGGGKGVTILPYADSSEMVADMSKPEYQDSPAFRKKVQDRVAISSFTKTKAS